MTSNAVAKMEANLRKILKFTVSFSKPDENGLLVRTNYFRTEKVVASLLRTSLVRPQIDDQNSHQTFMKLLMAYDM